MATPESHVKNGIKDILNANGIAYSMTVTMGFGQSGWPDFDIVLCGVFVSIEAKFELKRNKPTKNQKFRMAQIRANSGVTLLLDVMSYHHLATLIATCKRQEAEGDVTARFVREEATRLGIYYTEE